MSSGDKVNLLAMKHKYVTSSRPIRQYVVQYVNFTAVTDHVCLRVKVKRQLIVAGFGRRRIVNVTSGP